MSSEPVGVIGAGSWGTTLAKIAGDNGCPTLLWARRDDFARSLNESRVNADYLPGVELPANVTVTSDLERVAETCRLLLLVVPSHGFRDISYRLGDFVDGEHVVVHATKGIERDSFERMSEVLLEETCLRKIGVLTGPNLAGELAQKQPAGTLVASRFDEVFRRSHAALQTEYFRVYWGHDVIGAEVGGAFKNIVALAAGVASGLELGDNTKALLLTRGLSEMARLGAAMGARVITFGGMAGMGDLIATCASPLSRNHRVGVRLAAGEALADIEADMRMVAEGVKTTRAVHDYARSHRIDLPIVAAVHHLLYDGASAREFIDELTSIPTGGEFVDLTA